MEAKEGSKCVSDIDVSENGQRQPSVHAYHSGVTLVPHPSNDPRDPLNWPSSKKFKILAVISFATFSGFSACLAGQLQVIPQSKLYHVTTTQMAYQNSAGSAGMAAGGFFFFPLSHKIGRSSAIFWSLVLLLLSQVWASLMVHPNDFNGFIVSRFFGGALGTIAGVLGPRILVDMFFLHQRGRAFTVFHWCFDFGTVAGPTISAFIDADTTWENAFRWTAGLAGLAMVTVFLFLHETSWDRQPGAVNPVPPEGWFANRIATFLPGVRVTKKTTIRETFKIATTPFLIAFSPVTLTLSVFTLVHFGFYVAQNSLSPVFLQRPVESHGYGFTVLQNAEYANSTYPVSFSHWVGIVVALVYGQYISDRLPLYVCRHFGKGVWKPEYRLHALWVPSLIFNPLGLGLFGAGLYYHLSWGILALGTVFTTFGSLAITPITVNYINECFILNPAEASIAVNAFRVGFGLSVAFYINQWVAKVDVAWAYGMMAFFEIFSFFFIVLLMWKGHQIRAWTWAGLASSEEGEHLMEEKESTQV